MLIFKKNIYEDYGPSPDHADLSKYPCAFSPFEFIKAALEDEVSLLEIAKKQPVQYWEEDSRQFYPNANKVGNLVLLEKFQSILLEGLIQKDHWFYMNTYHFCVLYDILYRFTYNYNNDIQEEKLKALPKIKAASIPLLLFIKDFFFNTVFLLDSEKYNSMSPEEKRLQGFTCPCQFGVINGLMPTQEEMALKVSKDFPYQLYV